MYTHREGILQPVAPTGDGNFASFSFGWDGGLGEHTFVLHLDEHQNVTQTRTDNDLTSTVLNIIAPYNVSIGVPADPVRVLPGGQQDVMPLITSTGRLAGTWSMTIDASGLPTNWSLVDLDPSASSGVQIGVGNTWSPTLRISAPEEALGTDSGFVTITMTLDSDQNVTQTAILPIEAERTRGLSLRGADGTAISNGVGLPGEPAAAWILVENLGNAPETVSLQWNSTAWGNDITLHDSTGQEVIPLTLAPSEIRELTARLNVPITAALGDNVSTQLTMCIGAGVDEECRPIELTFTANLVQVMPPHIRSVPADDRTWNIEIQFPSGVDEMEWDMASAGMVMTGWNWETNGALSIDGTTLRATGNAGARVSGDLIVDMPFATPPMLHSWTTQEENNAGAVLSLSMQVLQIHRAELDVTSPVVQPHKMDVGVQETLMLRLSNPGNGPDAYDLSWTIVQNANFTEDPGLQIQFPSTQYALGAGELRSVPVSITLPTEMAAAVTMQLQFQMASQGDTGIVSTTDLFVEARQDHRWEMKLISNGIEVANGGTINADPNTQLQFELNVSNVGNLVDQISINPTISIQGAGSDDGTGWSTWGDASESIAVNGSEILQIGVNVSSTAWEDTEATISFEGLSDDTAIPAFVVHVRVNHVPGWWILAGGANLDIDRNGANVTLIVEQRGNSPATPYINGWVDVGGWTLNISQNLPMLDPGENTQFNCEIIPPEGAISGYTVELTLRARNADGSGMGQTTLPLRVAAWHDYALTHDEEWLISTAGGLPLAMLSNLGNAPTTIEVEVLGLPSGWSLEGASQVSLGVGESAGVPLSAIPSTDGSGYGNSVTLRTTDEFDTQKEVTLTLTASDRSWATSPVLFGTSGDVLELDFNPGFDVNSVQQDGALLVEADDGSWLWNVPPVDTDDSLTVDGVSLDYWARVRDPPTRIGTCSVNALDSIPVASCAIQNGTTDIDWTIILRDETGFVIDHIAGNIASNTSLSAINLSVDAWTPAPGEHTLEAILVDENGALIAKDSRVVMIRDSDWNLGITDVEVREEGAKQQIVVSTSRQNHSKLSQANCYLQLSASGWEGSKHLVDVAGDLAPQVAVDRPNLPVGTTVNLDLSCDAPWDQDSNEADDLGLIVLPAGIAEPSEERDYALLLGSLVIVFGAMGLFGLIRPDVGPRKVERRQRIRKRKKQSVTKLPKPIEDDDGDIQFDDDEDEDDLEEELLDFDDEAEEEIVEEVEEKPIPLDDFEARLERLRERRDRLGGE